MVKWWAAILIPVVLMLIGAAAPAVGPNLLGDGGFEASGKSWTLPEGASAVPGGREGGRSLRVATASPTYMFAQQSVLVDGRRYQKVMLSAWMKWTDVIRGREVWEGARMHLTFHDAEGKQLGGWPDAGVFSGSSDWRRVSESFPVPREAARVIVYLGLQDCAGTVWFDDVLLSAVDAQGRFAPKVTRSQTDTSRWLPFQPPKDEFGPSAIDMSPLLDAPAGKHGFIRVKKKAPPGAPAARAAGRLEFGDGSPARFWGVNVVAGNCFPDRAMAERVATRLARAGCNLVRFHHMDAAWASPNLFDPRFDDTQHLSADSLERLDFFMAELKKRGIYFFVDLAVHRKLKAGDGTRDWQDVEAGLKMVGEFNPRLIELQKQFATQLMTHRNPHTGLRLVDDPAVVFQEVINESTLFWSRLDTIPASYTAELRGMFSRWLAQRNETREALESAWRSDPEPLAEEEDPGKGTVHLARGAELDRIASAAPTPRVRDTLRFLHEVQTGYFAEMQAHLRTLGARYLIAGSNHWTSHYAEISTQLPFDFIDRHSYWAHPEGGYGWQNVSFSPSSALRQEALGPASFLARQAVLGKPYTSSEWQYSWPNEYRLEGVPLVAAHAARQGWDAAAQFEYAGGDWLPTIEGNFDAGNKPDEWAQWPAMALLFHRGDVPHDPTPLTTAPVSQPEVSREALGERLPAGAETREGVRNNLGIEEPSSPRAVEEKVVPLQHRPGHFLIDTPRTVAVVGFLATAGKLTVGPVTLESPTEFGSVIVSSLTDEPLTRSRRLLITTVGRAENSGLVYGPTRDTILKPGRAPILMDPVRGTLRLRREGGPALTIFRLDGVGRRAETLTPRREADGLALTLEERRLTLWYEAAAE